MANWGLLHQLRAAKATSAIANGNPADAPFIGGSTDSSNANLTVNPAGVSLALYAGITIDGVVGLTYGIQYSTNLSNMTGWQGMANVTLSVTPQLWFDLQPVTQPQRYYRVVPGPITIP